MKNDIIISIDWDHTLRGMHGIDLGLLALAMYAKSKSIPVGLTTHRDIENTTLYTLYYWQHKPPKRSEDALAAAISYWDKLCFKPFNLQFDFINARYQPRTGKGNYYQDVLYPLEQKLAGEIRENMILENPLLVQEKMHTYAQKEHPIENNDAKEAQIIWLCGQFKEAMIYHVDDSPEVCGDLPRKFSRLNKNRNHRVKTIFHETTPILNSEAYAELLIKIGLLEDMGKLFKQQYNTANTFEGQLKALAISLALLQADGPNSTACQAVEQLLNQLKPVLHVKHASLHGLIERLLKQAKEEGAMPSVLSNYFV